VLKAYADEHVAWAIVQALRQRGMDVVTVQERQGEGTADAEALAEALRDTRIVLTNDTDFLVLAARHTRQGEPFAPIFFWPQQSRRRVGEIVRGIIREASRTDYAAACSRVHFL
jgi:hypothetical protein